MEYCSSCNGFYYDKKHPKRCVEAMNNATYEPLNTSEHSSRYQVYRMAEPQEELEGSDDEDEVGQAQGISATR